MKRTDLALEARECVQGSGEISGVILEQQEKETITISTVHVRNQRGSQAIGKPVGSYITIEAKEKRIEEEGFVAELERQLRRLLPKSDIGNILVVGLGNREITPDALGPWVVDQLLVTRHLYQQFGDKVKDWGYKSSVEAIAPGVMAQTGMEVQEIVQGIIDRTHPECVLVIDALAARNVNRLFRTVQITNTGISPGAGVGNRRCELNRESLGVEVIAIGVPTVVDSATIIEDAMEQFLLKIGWKEQKAQQQMEQFHAEQVDTMFMTDKEVDKQVEKGGEMIARAINRLVV